MSAIVFPLLPVLAPGLPIAHALVIGSTVALGHSDRGSLSLVVEQMVSQVGSFPLLAIPFFMLTGSIMMGGTLGRNLLDLLSTLMAASTAVRDRSASCPRPSSAASAARPWPTPRRSARC